MYSLKGFVTISGLVNNAVGMTSPLGELSTFSTTFTKDQGLYVSATYPNIQFVSFASKQSDSPIAIPDAYKNGVFAVAGITYVGLIDTTNSSDRALFLQTLISQLGDQYANVDCGEMINQGQYWAPEWISWNPTNSDDYFKIWFSDSSFQAQFDDYEIIVVCPLAAVDNFFQAGTVVEAALKEVSATSMVNSMQDAKGGCPESYIAVEEYDYINPAKTADFVASKWGVVIYGTAGNNDDNIRDAIIDYIMAHTTHSRDEWVTILPDLFKKTEFIIVPLYDQYAIPNRTLLAGIYSPVVTMRRVYKLMDQVVPDYTSAHVSTNLSVMTHTYKSLIMAIIGGPENHAGKYLLTDYYPDYIAVETASTDFNRMSVATQKWAIKLATLVQKAEDVTSVSQVPAGFTRVKRSGLVFLAMSVNKVQYLVLAKSNFTALDAGGV